MAHIWSQIILTWLPQPTDITKQNHFILVNLTGTVLRFGIIVAKHSLCGTHCGKSLSKTLALTDGVIN